MSEDNKPIAKNPGRVAWGKQLASMSRELKAKKMSGLIKEDIKIDKETKSKLNTHHIEVMIGIGGLLVGVIALYLQYKNTQHPVPQINTTPSCNNPYTHNYNNF